MVTEHRVRTHFGYSWRDGHIRGHTAGQTDKQLIGPEAGNQHDYYCIINQSLTALDAIVLFFTLNSVYCETGTL